MGPNDNNKEIILYIDGQRVAVLSELYTIHTIPTIEPGPGGTLPDFGFTQLTATIRKSCRSRKRFIKLAMGVFGLPRNNAAALADIAMEHGCPSYQDLWADCFTYFIKKTLESMAGALKST